MRASPLLQVVFGALIAAHAWAFEEGIDYTKLTNPQAPESGEKIEVLEVFMYSCPHCFYLEPPLKEWLKTKPEQVRFKRMPAIFSDRVIPHARAYYAAEELGEIDQFHLPLFRALHDHKRAIWDEDALVTFAEKQGINAKRFREAYRSFSVDGQVRQAWKLGRSFGIDSVPTLIVDGKYRTSPSQTGSYEKTIQVIDYLIGIETNRSSATTAGGS